MSRIFRTFTLSMDRQLRQEGKIAALGLSHVTVAQLDLVEVQENLFKARPTPPPSASG